jgi:mono/diheme cytochrome c family protein
VADSVKTAKRMSMTPGRGSLIASAGYCMGIAAVVGWYWAGRRADNPVVPARSQFAKLAVAERTGYVGAEVCAECHRSRFEGFAQTTHYLTSRPASRENILGSFEPGKNVLHTRLAHLWLEMTADEQGCYQTAMSVVRGETKKIFSARFDIVTGSGKLGQTYLYWTGNRLFQLPASYLTSSQDWINSPGFRDGVLKFDRPIVPGCLECHATYIQSAPGDVNVFAHDSIIYGISCERCHGPGRDHVTHHRAHPDERAGRHIIHPRHLSRERLLDLCAQCHSGGATLRRPAFTYRAGEDLAEYIAFDQDPRKLRFKVHSNNQLPRLRQSRCFQESDSLTCADCHNPHRLERGRLEVFSERCQKCHDPEQCGPAARLGTRALANCIDCHMPKRNDEETPFSTPENDRLTPVWMREHRVAIYPQDTAQFQQEIERGGR